MSVVSCCSLCANVFEKFVRYSGVFDFPLFVVLLSLLFLLRLSGVWLGRGLAVPRRMLCCFLCYCYWSERWVGLSLPCLPRPVLVLLSPAVFYFSVVFLLSSVVLLSCCPVLLSLFSFFLCAILFLFFLCFCFFLSPVYYFSFCCC